MGVRISPCSDFNDMSDSNPSSIFGYVAERLSARRIAYLHVVETRSVDFDWGRWRRAYTGTYMANEGYGLESATLAVKTGHADLVSFGAPFIANPDLVARFLHSAPSTTATWRAFMGETSGDIRTILIPTAANWPAKLEPYGYWRRNVRIAYAAQSIETNVVTCGRRQRNNNALPAAACELSCSRTRAGPRTH